MSVLWLVPVAVLVLGTVTIAAMIRGVGQEGRALVAEVARFGEIHLAMARVNDELTRSRAIVGADDAGRH
jgi:hypothetical protein